MGAGGQRLEPAQARKCPRPRPPARTAATPGPPSEGTDVAPRSRGASVAPTADARQRRAGATTSGRFSPLLGNGTLREAQVRTQNTRRHCCVCTDDSAASAPALFPGTLRSQRAPRRATPRPAGPQQRARDRVSSIGQQERPPRARGGNSVQSEHGHWRGQAKRRLDRRVGAELPVGAWSLRGATEAEVGSEAAVGSGGQRLGPPWNVLERAPRSGWRLFLSAASQKRPWRL
ncbi:uncharacterized protein LOC114675007 isoform X2 [Macaca mulatta]